MTQQLENWILNGHFDEARIIAKDFSYRELDEELMNIAYKDASIVHYSFVMSLLVEEENVHLHEIAFRLMVNPLSYLDGAYYAAMYHARRCMELTERKDIRYLSNLLFLHLIPNQVVGEEEAYATAKRMLALDPGNQLARECLKRRKQGDGSPASV